jgi:DNA-binding MarR family transcriptional regulator
MLSSGAITNRIDRLEERGLVRRTPDPADRRGVLVELTPAGRGAVDQAVERHLANEHRLLAGLTPAERDELAALLRRLLLTLDDVEEPGA